MTNETNALWGVISEILDVLKQSPAWEWIPDYIFGSALFFILYENLETTGKLSPNIWSKLLYNLMFIDAGKQLKLLNVIERNWFFELYPQFAINGAKDFFLRQERLPDLFFQYIQAPRQTLYTILKLLQLKEAQIQPLVNETFKTRSFSKIITFLESYNLPTPNLLNITELEILLTKFGLPEEKRKYLLTNISQNLNNSD